MSGLYLVADDLTGALDSAAPFCDVYGPIPVYLGAPHADPAPHAAVDLATRDDTQPSAGLAAARVLPHLARAGIAYKKVDSRLRGHWAAELAELVRSGVFGGCVFAPAFPSQGRTTLQGRHWVRGSDGASHALPADPLHSLRAQGLRVAQAGLGTEARVGAARLADSDVVLFDALTDADLEAIVDAVPDRVRDKPVLWCGAGGLARALVRGARRDATPLIALPRPTLAIIGTDHAVSRAQVAHAVALGTIPQVAVKGHAADTVARIRLALEGGPACLLTFEFPVGTEPPAAAASIEQDLALLLPQLPRPASLVVAGGQTLLAVCRAVGATHLEVVAERSAGVPCSRLRGGRWDGIDVVSKSGGFGSSAWLAELLAAPVSSAGREAV